MIIEALLTLAIHGATVQPSEYTGHLYVHQDEPIRKCIVHRESNNHPTSVSRGGHGGLYQMTPALWHGAVWMMRMDKHDPITKAQRLKLQAIPIWHASRYWQTRAFWTIWRDGKGAQHWAGGRWSCP
jgi:hypothetical protein